jgi:hypothetical protein
MAGHGIRAVDVLVVSPRTTPGLRRDHDELLRALHRLELTTAVATSHYGAIGRLRRLAYVADETIVFAALAHATHRVLQRVRPRFIFITTSVGGALLPSQLLERAAIRFDGLATATRRQWWGAGSRALERRCLRRAAVLLPYTTAVARDAQTLIGSDRPSIVWPSPVRPGPPPAQERWPAGLCYANNPDKKGLDIAVSAWKLAAPGDHRLLIAGIEPAAGQRFLRARGVDAPSNLEWCGRLPETRYRQLSASVLVHVGSSRVDEFATTQLEALMDGALLVTGPSQGPIEALHLARAIEPRLVAAEMTPEGLAVPIREALRLDSQEREAYRRRAREALEPYTREAFINRLRDEVLPALYAS